MVLYAGRTANGIPPMAQALAANPRLRVTGYLPDDLTHRAPGSTLRLEDGQMLNI
jgi:hypothetical protein